MAKIYLIAQRKNWNHDLPEGWIETHWERFDFVECGVYFKPDQFLTQQDKDDWVAYYSSEPDGWIPPSLVNGIAARQEEVESMARQEELENEPTGLQWSEERPPTTNASFYDHVVAHTPLGDIFIEWKGWKENDSKCAHMPWKDDVTISEPTLEEAKNCVQHKWNLKVAEMQALVKPTNMNEKDD